MRYIICLIIMFFTVGESHAQSQKKLVVGGGYYLNFENSPPTLDTFPVPFSRGVAYSDNNEILLYSTGSIFKGANHDTIVHNPAFLENTVDFSSMSRYQIYSTQDTNVFMFIAGWDKYGQGGLISIKLNRQTKSVEIDTLFKENRKFSSGGLLFYNDKNSFWYLTASYNKPGDGMDSITPVHALLFEQDKLKKVVTSYLPFIVGNWSATGISKNIVCLEYSLQKPDSAFLHRFEFDNNSGKVEWVQKKSIWKNGMNANGDSSISIVHSAQLSPNDSFFYVKGGKNSISFSPVTGQPIITSESFLRQIPVYESGSDFYSIGHLYEDFPHRHFGDLSLGDDGKIYFTAQGHSGDMRDPHLRYVGIINYPDKKGLLSQPEVLSHIPCREFVYNRFGDKSARCVYPDLFLQKNYLHHKLNIIHSLKCDSLYLEASGDSAFKSWTWYLTSPSGITDSFIQKNLALQMNESGNYKIKLLAKTNKGYYTWRTDSIYIPKPPSIEIKVDTAIVCYPNDNGFMIDLSVDDNLNGVLHVSCGAVLDTTFTSPLPDKIYIALPSPELGIHIIKASYNDEYCSATVADTFFVKPSPTAEFNLIPAQSSLVDSVVTFINLSKNAHSYIWQIDDSSFNMVSPVYSFNNPGAYEIRLIAYNDNCTDTAYGNIRIFENFYLFIPNAFSPNNNNVNETWEAIGSGIKAFSLVIYSRWGEAIFRTSDIKQGWNGTYKGKALPPGVYVWKISATGYTGKHFIESGTVHLIR